MFREIWTIIKRAFGDIKEAILETLRKPRKEEFVPRWLSLGPCTIRPFTEKKRIKGLKKTSYISGEVRYYYSTNDVKIEIIINDTQIFKLVYKFFEEQIKLTVSKRDWFPLDTRTIRERAPKERLVFHKVRIESIDQGERINFISVVDEERKSKGIIGEIWTLEGIR